MKFSEVFTLEREKKKFLSYYKPYLGRFARVLPVALPRPIAGRDHPAAGPQQKMTESIA